MDHSRRSLLFGASAAMICAPNLLLSQPILLRQRTSGRLPRSEYIEGKGWMGYEIDFTNAIMETVAGAGEVKFGRFFNWARALKAMEHGGLELMNGVSYRDDRALFMDYIGSTDIEDTYLVTRVETETGPLNTLDELASFSLPVQVNFAAAWNLAFDKAINTDPAYAKNFANHSGSAYDNRDQFLESTLNRIMNDRVSGALLTYYTAFDLIDLADSFGYRKEQLKLSRVNLFGSPETYFTIARSVDEGLRNDIRAGFESLRESQRALEIWTKWYGDRSPPSWERPLQDG